MKAGIWRRRLAALALVGAVVMVGRLAWTLRLPVFVVGPGPVVPVDQVVQVQGAGSDPAPPGQVRWLLTTIVAHRATLGQVLSAAVDPGQDVVPWSRLIPPGHDLASFQELNRRLMEESQLTAAYAALSAVGRPARLEARGAEVLAVWPGTAGERAGLRAGDVIVRAGDAAVRFADDFRTALAGPAAGTLKLVVNRGGRPVTIVLEHPEPSTPGGLGLVVASRDLRAAFDSEIRLSPGEVAGPSAGLAFGLFLLDRFLGGALPGPDRVAATGTLHMDGSVGSVGGVRFKARAVARAGADVFLVPAADVDEARRGAPGLQVIGVSSLEEAVRVLKALAAGPGSDGRRALTPISGRRYNGAVFGGDGGCALMCATSAKCAGSP